MGLLAWYPLIEDTKNYGIDGQNLEVKGEITYTEGKIGKSATFVGSPANCLYRDGFKLEDDFTWCAWIKITNNNVQQYLLSEGRDYDLRGFNIYCPTTPALVATWGGKHTGQYLAILSTIELNTWYHIAVTVNSEQGVKAYVNGEFVKEGLYSKPDYTYSNDKFVIGKMAYSYSNNNNYFPTSGQIQDVRIYNETLSPMQIKLISQGLVAHYLLNNNGSGNNNLALNSYNLNIVSTKDNKNISNRGTTTLQLREDGFYETKVTNSWGGICIYANSLNLQVGDKITFSFYIYINGSSKTVSFYPMMYNSSGTRDMSSTLPISVDGGTYTTVNSKSIGQINNTIPQQHYITFEWNSAMKNILDNGGKIELSIQIHGTWQNGDYACIFAPKLEYGDKPTSWCPNSEDALATQLGYNDNTEYDVSGYCHNGTKYNIADYTSDTPRYSVATKFETNAYINIGRGGMVRDEITVNIWGYMDDWTKYNGRLISCTEGGGWNFEASSSKIYFAMGTGTTSNAYKNTSGYALSELSSGWHMFTGTYDGLVVKQYIDGVFNTSNNAYTTKTPIHYHSSNSILIGAEASGSQTPTANYYFNGNLSDVRIYATALSDADILSLYKNSAFVDSSGNVYSTEYIES